MLAGLFFPLTAAGGHPAYTVQWVDECGCEHVGDCWRLLAQARLGPAVHLQERPVATRGHRFLRIARACGSDCPLGDSSSCQRAGGGYLGAANHASGRLSNDRIPGHKRDHVVKYCRPLNLRRHDGCNFNGAGWL